MTEDHWSSPSLPLSLVLCYLHRLYNPKTEKKKVWKMIHMNYIHLKRQFLVTLNELKPHKLS